MEIATLLLKKGAAVNATAEGGTTPLTLAVVNHQDRMADLLRQYGGHE